MNHFVAFLANFEFIGHADWLSLKLTEVLWLRHYSGFNNYKTSDFCWSCCR